MVKKAITVLPMWAVIVFYAVGVGAIQMIALQMTTEVGRLAALGAQFLLTGALLYGMQSMRKTASTVGEVVVKVKAAASGEHTQHEEPKE